MLKQVLKTYRPELSLRSMTWFEEPEKNQAVTDFFKAYDIPGLARAELGYLEGDTPEQKFLNEAFFTQSQCYTGGGFSNLEQYIHGLTQSGLDRENVRYLAFLRLLLIQDCVLESDAYMESTKTKETLQKIKSGNAKGWFGYIEAAAFYHDGFYPEAADLFATIAREEKEAGRSSGWLIETARYMEILSLFHKGREGQDEVFLPTVFNSFTEAFISDFPKSIYRKHVEGMSVGIWLHYDERERYYAELLQMLSQRAVLTNRSASLDELDELSINAVLANINDIADYPIDHGNGFTLLPAILSKTGDVSGLCAQAGNLPQKTPQELTNYIGMTCAYLMQDAMPDASVFVNTSLYAHAKAFEMQVLLEQGKLAESSRVFAEMAGGLKLPLKDLLGLRSRQFEERLRQGDPVGFVAIDRLVGAKVSPELSIMDSVLYEQLSRYFLSATQFAEVFSFTDSELLKFSLIRPHLDEAMIQENWQAARELSALIQWQDLLATKALDISEKLTVEINHYVEINEDLIRLSQDRNDPKALSDVAYFLYENHVAPRCGYERPLLIQAVLDVCRPGYLAPSEKGFERVAPKSIKDIRVPVEMLADALKTYKGQKGFRSEEARLLRVMIHCAKGATNVAYCLRWKKIPRAHFKGWFEDLNLHYPAKEHVQYWFYDLPQYSLFDASNAASVEQQYWYDEDAYLGYLDGGPYSLELLE